MASGKLSDGVPVVCPDDADGHDDMPGWDVSILLSLKLSFQSFSSQFSLQLGQGNVKFLLRNLPVECLLARDRISEQVKLSLCSSSTVLLWSPMPFLGADRGTLTCSHGLFKFRPFASLRCLLTEQNYQWLAILAVCV